MQKQHGGEIFTTPRILASKLILSKTQTIQDSVEVGEEEQRIELV